MVLIGVVLLGVSCGKRNADYERCVDLERRGNLHAAHAACDNAARGAPGTELGEKAAERKAAIERRLQAELEAKNAAERKALQEALKKEDQKAHPDLIAPELAQRRDAGRGDGGCECLPADPLCTCL